MRVYIYVLLSVFLGLPPFQPIERALERRIRRDSGVEDANVRIHAGRLAFLFLGLCRRVTVELRGLQVGGLRTDLFKIEAHGLRFRTFNTFVLGKVRVRGASDILWSIRLLDEDLEKFVRRKSPILNKIQVRIDQEQVTLHRGAGIASLLSINETFTLRGRLRLSEKKDVILDLDHFSAFGVSPGRTLRTTVSALINPIIKAADINRILSRNPVEALENVVPQTQLEDIVLDTGHAEISGNVQLVPDKKNATL